MMEKFNFLNDQERKLIEDFYKNEPMREAVRKVLLMGIYNNGVIKEGKPHDPTLNWALSLVWGGDLSAQDDTKVGQALRSTAEGIRFLQMAFIELSKFDSKPAVEKPKKNPAR